MLTKKDKKKRYNKKTRSLTGHEFSGTWTEQSRKAWENAGGSNLGGSISSVAGGIGGIVEAGMANAPIADTTEQEQEREARENWQSSASDNDSLLAEMASDVSINENTNWKSIRGVTPGQMVGNTLKGVVSGAGAGAKVGGPWGAVAGAAVGLAGGLAGIFAGNSKARKKAGELNEAAKKANLAKAQTLTAKAGALDQAADQRALAAYAAYGGDINTPKFPDFPSEITEFNAGGSHEENPYDGIPQGIAPDGLPNLVEEGEVKYDNYIFSDRLMLNKNDKKKYKFLKGKTYADAAKAIKKELGIDERPNDLIAKTDLEEHLNVLSTLQEEERAKKGLRGENRMMYKNGGHLFAGDEDYDGQYEREGRWAAYDGILPFSTPSFPSPSLMKPELEGRPDFVSEDAVYNLAPTFNKKGIVKKDKKGNTIYKRLSDDEANYPLVTGKNAQLTPIGFPTSREVTPITASDLQLNTPAEWRKSSTQQSQKTSPNTGSSFLQAAPAIGSAIGTIASIFDRPTYEHTKRLTQAEKPITPITYTPTHQDIRLDRFDTNYHANKLAAQAGATRRAVREQTASNPYAATAALLSADANAQSQMGDLYRKAAEYNQGIALQEAQFNEAGRRADAEGLLKAASANATLRDKVLTRQAEKDVYAARLNMAEDQAYDTAVSANMTSLFDNLGAIGKEDQEFALAAMKIMGEGKLTPEMQATMLPKLQKILAKAGYKYGGKLRKKKGYTI